MTVIIPKKVYLTIIASTVRFANTRIPFDDWLEVYGIFIGKNKGNDVIISEVYPITHQKKNPEDVIDTVYTSPEDLEAYSKVDDEAFSRGEFQVGWYHSHPGMKIMMTHLDLITTFNYQVNNPLAISLVINPQRLLKQTELPDKKGDPEIKLKNDPGFEIFRFLDVNSGVHSEYIKAEYKIEGFDSMEQLVQEAKKFVIEVTNFFPKDKIFKRYKKFVDERVKQLNSLLTGTEEYLKTLVRQGEMSRIPEVLENQKKEIRQNVAETFIKVGNIKQYMDFLEYKERESTIPKVHSILSKWDEAVSNLDEKLVELSKKF